MKNRSRETVSGLIYWIESGLAVTTPWLLSFFSCLQSKARRFFSNVLFHFLVTFLRTTALVHHHLRQISFDNVRVRTVVNERHGRELERRATRLHTGQPVHLPVFLDHVGVIVEKRVRRPVTSRAVSSTVIGVVSVERICISVSITTPRVC